MAKRYILLAADADLTETERKELRSIIERRHSGARLIEVEGSSRAVIVKSTETTVFRLRDPGSSLAVGGKKLRPVLTSGAIGNLKRKVTEAEANGQVHE